MQNDHLPVSAVLLMLREGLEGIEVLAMERTHTVDYEPGKSCLPSGKGLIGESGQLIIEREAMEELGIVCLDLTLVHTMICYRDNPLGFGNRWVDYFYASWVWEPNPKIMEPHKARGFNWHQIKYPPADLILFQKIGIELIFKGQVESVINLLKRP